MFESVPNMRICLGVGWLGPTKGWSDLAIGLASIRRDLSLLSRRRDFTDQTCAQVRFVEDRQRLALLRVHATMQAWGHCCQG